MKISAGVYYEITKAVIFGLVVVALAVGAMKGYQWLNAEILSGHSGIISTQQAQIDADNRKFKTYEAEIARAHTEIVKKQSELEDAIKQKTQYKQAWQDALSDAKKNHEQVVNMGETIATLNDNIRKLKTASSHVYKPGTGDVNEQYFIDIMYPVKDKDGKVIKEVPYAWAIFYPNRPEGQKWKYGIYKLDYHVLTVQTQQKSGQYNTYNQVWFENNQRKQSKDYQVPVKITSSEFKQVQKTESEFYWWAPHLNLNLDMNVGKFDSSAIAGGVSFSTSGYGRTENDLIWRFIDFGISTNGDDTYFKFTPFAYNVGENLPLISNTFIGPFVGYSIRGDISFGIGISVPF